MVNKDNPMQQPTLYPLWCE